MQIIENDINPHVDAWEKAGQFPRWVFKKFGEAGLLGVQHPVGVNYHFFSPFPFVPIIRFSFLLFICFLVKYTS